MFENPRTGRQARNFTANVSKILDLKSSSEQIFFRKLSLGAPGHSWPKLANCRFKCPCPIYTKERESRKHSDLITRGGTSHVSTNATMQSSPVLKRGGIQKLIWTLTRILARNRVQSKLDEPHLKQTPNF